MNISKSESDSHPIKVKGTHVLQVVFGFILLLFVLLCELHSGPKMGASVMAASGVLVLCNGIVSMHVFVLKKRIEKIEREVSIKEN